MRTVWKFPIGVDRGWQPLNAPMRVKALCVQMQDGNPMLWAEVYDEDVKTEWEIFVAWTGDRLPGEIADIVYVGTFQHDTGLVYHVYAFEREA
jgi:hypothetical protein